MSPVNRNAETSPVFLSDPIALLERAFIEIYLKNKGTSLQGLKKLPRLKARRLRIEASIYASGRLAEIEARAALVTEMHAIFVE